MVSSHKAQKKCVGFRLGVQVIFFYRNLAAAKTVNFCKLVRNVMEHFF